MEITRKSVLLECLEYERGIMWLSSKDHEGRLPAKGEEDLFYDQQKKCKILEELIHSLDSPEVRKVLADWQKMADWQKEVMKNGPSVLKLDGKEPEMRFYEG